MGKRPVIQLLEPQADSSGPERKTRGTNPTVTGRAASLPDCLWQPFDIFPVWKCSTRGPNNRRHPAFCRFQFLKLVNISGVGKKNGNTFPKKSDTFSPSYTISVAKLMVGTKQKQRCCIFLLIQILQCEERDTSALVSSPGRTTQGGVI